MAKRTLAHLCIRTVILGSCIVAGAAQPRGADDSEQAAQTPAESVVTGPVAARQVAPVPAPVLAPEPGVVEQMQVLEYNARVNMLLYLPSRTSQATLDAFALSVASR